MADTDYGSLIITGDASPFIRKVKNTLSAPPGGGARSVSFTDCRDALARAFFIAVNAVDARGAGAYAGAMAGIDEWEGSRRMFDEKLTDTANKLVQYCRDDNAQRSLDELYAEDAVSVEAADMGGGNVVTEGLNNIRGKHEWWNNAMEVHSAKVEGPFLHGENQFGVIFDIDATQKENGERMKMRELGVYTVEDGKIKREEFFFQPH